MSKRSAVLAGTAAVLVALVAIIIATSGSSDDSKATPATASTPTSAASKLQAGTLKVGYPVALTGFLEAFDGFILNGTKLAIEEINAGGGIGGKVKIELTTSDTRSDSTTERALAQEAIDGGAQVVLGSCIAESANILATVAQRAGVVAVSSCSSNAPTLGKTFPNYWGVGLPPNVLASKVAEIVKDEGHSSVYELYSEGGAFFLDLKRFFEDAAGQLDLKIVGKDTFQVGQTDFASAITKIKNANPKPEVIATSMVAPDVGSFLRQLRASGVTTPVIGFDGMDSPLTISVGKKGAEGALFATHGFPEAGSKTAKFYADYKTRFGKEPSSIFSAIGYNTAHVVAAAVEKAGSTDPKAIQAALLSGLDIKTALWSIKYPAGEHSPIEPAATVTVKNGKFEMVNASYPKVVAEVDAK